MAHPAAGAHARARHDHGPACDPVYRDRVGAFADEAQPGEAKGIAMIGEQLRNRSAVQARMATEDFGRADREG